MNVVGSRVDWLTLAYRVELSAELVAYLESRTKIAREHGRSSVRFGSIVGEVGYSRTPGVWHIRTERYVLHILRKGPGSEELEDGTVRCGWTVELIWDPQELANMPHTGPACEEGARIAGELGNVLEQRVRRLDLCCDVAGWRVSESDTLRLVRRARAKVDSHCALAPIVNVLDAEYSQTKVHRSHAMVTGITVCPGGRLLCRIYDKREELAVRGVPEKTKAEEARWLAAGWDGMSEVTRVEFQMQGEAIKELGIRDPFGPINASTGKRIANFLHERLDAIWQFCTHWLKLVRLVRKRLSDCPLDPVWEALRWVLFVSPARRALRFRVRGHASAEQTLGCALSIVGARVGLPEVKPWSAMHVRDPKAALERVLNETFASASTEVGKVLIDKWKGPAKALEHVLVTHDARRARYGDYKPPRDELELVGGAATA